MKKRLLIAVVTMIMGAAGNLIPVQAAEQMEGVYSTQENEQTEIDEVYTARGELGVDSTFEVDGFTYRVIGVDEQALTGELEVTGFRLEYSNFSDVNRVILKSIVNYEGISFTVTSLGGDFSETLPNEVCSVEIPSTITTIQPGSIVSGSVMIVVHGSAGEKYAIENNEPYIYIGETAKGQCGRNTFWELDTKGVLTISGSGRIEETGWSDYRYMVGTIDIQEGVTEIDDNAMEYDYGPARNVSLKNVKFPSSLKKIGASSFTRSRNLTEITLPENLETIGSNAFSECDNLQTVRTSENLLSIGDGAFQGCSNLKGIQIPGKVQYIGYSAFASCNSIETVTIPSSIEHISSEVFGECVGLTKVIITPGVKSIENGAFSNCTKLTEVIIGEGLETIEDEVFAGCSQLVKIQIPLTQEFIAPSTFNRSYKVNIYGYTNSYAETYAVENGISFVSTGVSVKSITLNLTEKEIEHNTSFQLTATCNPQEAEGVQPITWYSEHPDIADVNENGLVTATENPGVVNIVAQCGSKYAFCKVSVKPYVESISVNPSIATVNRGDIQQYSTGIGMRGNMNPTLQWTLSGQKSSRTTLSSKGTLTVAQDETAAELTIKVTVKEDPAAIATAKVKITGDSQGEWVRDTKGLKYKNPDGTYAYNTWIQLDNHWYHVDANGYRQHGWLKSGGKWYYLQNDGSRARGWMLLSGKWYYLNASGVMQTKWIQLGSKYYYLESSGAMAAKKWIGNYYVTSSGAMAVNTWVGNYYVGKDGAKLRNTWIGKYYVGADGKWIPSYSPAKWKKDSKGWWYKNIDGSHAKNCWKKIDNKWYHFNTAGYMQTGWLRLGSKWYYLDKSGAMAVNKWIGSSYVGADVAWIPGYKK